jgi:glycosyltransferase involved in cell wall biosynthesis
MNEDKIFIVIPAFNEETKIAQVIKQITQYFKNIIVVDDNSSDNTLEILKTTGALVLSHVINRGQGAALETGNKYALTQGAEIIVHFDADGQFLAEEISKIIEPILKGEADIVMGTRFMSKESNMPAFKKYFIMPIARLVMRILYKVELTDPQNGFRAFNRKVANELTIENDGAAHCTEIIVKTLKNKWLHKEVPITVHYDRFGASIFSGKGRGAGGIKILKSLFLNKLIK